MINKILESSKYNLSSRAVLVEIENNQAFCAASHFLCQKTSSLIQNSITGEKSKKQIEFADNAKASNHIAIVKNRKSRIIMKDGEKILESAKQIQSVSPKTKVSLITNAPVCSKTTKYLFENGIKVINEYM